MKFNVISCCNISTDTIFRVLLHVAATLATEPGAHNPWVHRVHETDLVRPGTHLPIGRPVMKSKVDRVAYGRTVRRRSRSRPYQWTQSTVVEDQTARLLMLSSPWPVVDWTVRSLHGPKNAILVAQALAVIRRLMLETIASTVMGCSRIRLKN